MVINNSHIKPSILTTTMIVERSLEISSNKKISCFPLVQIIIVFFFIFRRFDSFFFLFITIKDYESCTLCLIVFLIRYSVNFNYCPLKKVSTLERFKYSKKCSVGPQSVHYERFHCISVIK